uniref:Uncharacterized protein n=1 Tax=Steinernema glaseri TaxID=37863 RepID=A0A1I7ZRN0_9BILA
MKASDDTISGLHTPRLTCRRLLPHGSPISILSNTVYRVPRSTNKPLSASSPSVPAGLPVAVISSTPHARARTNRTSCAALSKMI